MAKEGCYKKDLIEENLKYYLYQKYKFCPRDCNIIDSFNVKAPFALSCLKEPDKIGFQDPDAAYITKNRLGLCGECIGQTEYKNPGGKKTDSLSHKSIQEFYNGKKINIYLAQKVLVQLFRTYLELLKKGAAPVISYFSGENTIPIGQTRTLDELEIYPTLEALKHEGHILEFEKVNDNICCKPDISIYEIKFPERGDVKKVLGVLNGGVEIDIDQI